MDSNNFKICFYMKDINWKKVVEFLVALLTLVGSFLGGQATARNGLIDLFNTQNVECHVKL